MWRFTDIKGRFFNCFYRPVSTNTPECERINDNTYGYLSGVFLIDLSLNREKRVQGVEIKQMTRAATWKLSQSPLHNRTSFA